MTEHKFDRSLVVIYPVDKTGARILDSYTKIVEVDSEKIKITHRGTLMEKWKAEFVCFAPQYFFFLDEDDLAERGVEQGTNDWNRMFGAITDKPMFKMRQPAEDELLSIAAPIDESVIQAVIGDNEDYKLVWHAFAPAIRAQMRSNPNTDLTTLFAGLANALETAEVE